MEPTKSNIQSLYALAQNEELMQKRLEARNALLEELREKFPGITNAKINALLRENEYTIKPDKWSKKSNAPYYRERYALQIKQVFDTMIKDFENGIYEERVFYYKDTPELSKNTLYLKINQAKLYLLDKLDADGRYRHFDSLIKIKKEANLGVKITYKDGVLVADEDGKSIQNPINVVNFIEKKSAIDMIDAWLDKATPGDKLHLKKLFLPDDELYKIKSMIAGLDDIAASITQNDIHLVKMHPE